MERLNLSILQGKTFTRVIRWEQEPFIYAAITGITKTAPAVVTAPNHGIPDGWRVAPVSVQGMREINAADSPPSEDDFVRATVLSSNTVELNTVNAAEFSTYTSGGYLQFYTPASLAGCTARMTIRNRIGGDVLDTLTSGAGITLNDSAKTITVQIEASDTAAYNWTKGVYDLEVEDADGVVTGLYFGTVTVSKEVTL